MSHEIAPLRRPIRVALIGTGKMGLHHLQAMKRVEGATIVAVADPTANADAIAAAVGAPVEVFADARAMLETARPEAVHIVTPPGTHAALGRLALQAGANVYIEKPFTPTRAEADPPVSAGALTRRSSPEGAAPVTAPRAWARARSRSHPSTSASAAPAPKTPTTRAMSGTSTAQSAPRATCARPGLIEAR